MSGARLSGSMGRARGFAVVCLAVCWSVHLPAHAQTPPGTDDQPYEEIIGRQEITYFDPAKFGMTKVETPDRLYDLLTQAQRCPPGQTAKRKTPCAFISYAPPGTNEAAYQQSLRPVFKVVSPEAIWTMMAGGPALVGVKNLEGARDLTDPNDPDRKSYAPVAVVGTQENEAACKAGRTCVDTGFFGKLVDEVRILSDGCVQEIWDKKVKVSEPGEQSRCRYRTDSDIRK
jgi:hypothetical protein